MRADIEEAYECLKENQDEQFHERLKKILELEKYTLLTPPYEKEAVDELFEKAQQELNFKFTKDYYRFLRICDGGLLFTNTFFSILNPDDENDDLVSVNQYLHEENIIPEEAIAIGETNYGAYFVQKRSGEKEFGIWDPENESYIANYNDFNELLDDVINEANYLLEDGSLYEIED